MANHSCNPASEDGVSSVTKARRVINKKKTTFWNTPLGKEHYKSCRQETESVDAGKTTARGRREGVPRAWLRPGGRQAKLTGRFPSVGGGPLGDLRKGTAGAGAESGRRKSDHRAWGGGKGDGTNRKKTPRRDDKSSSKKKEKKKRAQIERGPL